MPSYYNRMQPANPDEHSSAGIEIGAKIGFAMNAMGGNPRMIIVITWPTIPPKHGMDLTGALKTVESLSKAILQLTAIETYGNGLLAQGLTLAEVEKLIGARLDQTPSYDGVGGWHGPDGGPL